MVLRFTRIQFSNQKIPFLNNVIKRISPSYIDKCEFSKNSFRCVCKPYLKYPHSNTQKYYIIYLRLDWKIIGNTNIVLMKIAYVM